MAAPGMTLPSPSALWQQRRQQLNQRPLLVGLGGAATDAQLVAQVEARRRWLTARLVASPLAEALAPEASLRRPRLLLAESEPVAFITGLWAALLAGWDVALANPHCSPKEWAAIQALTVPDVVWGKEQGPLGAKTDFGESSPAVLIPTGGSSGRLRFARHTWSTLMTSVEGFCEHFAPHGEAVNACCVLPLYHVSGLMQLLRVWASGGQLAIAPFRQLEADPQACLGGLDPAACVMSLVPTQLARLLTARQGSWLGQFKAVVLGGAPPWPALLQQALDNNIALYLSYGMTETAAMVTVAGPLASSPSAGAINQPLSSGFPLTHASLEIWRDGQRLPADAVGQIVIRSAAVARGYLGEPSSAFAGGTFYTDDLGYVGADGQLYLTGRASSKIISGGENIFPAEVEAALRQTGLVRDVCVLGVPHPQWGEAVAAAYEPAHDQISEGALRAAIAPYLSRYKYPKYWLALDRLPRNAQGKINRAALTAKFLSAQFIQTQVPKAQLASAELRTSPQIKPKKAP